MALVIEEYSFYDDAFSSLMYPLFCHNLPSVRRPDGVCHAGSWRVLSTWRVHVSGDVAWHVAGDVSDYVATDLASDVDVHVSTFIGPQGMLWVVHVSCCDWLSFSSLKWLQIHHWIDYKIVTESTTKSSQKGNKIHHRCTCWTTDHSIPITINLTDPVFIGTINLMNNTKLGSHITH